MTLVTNKTLNLPRVMNEELLWFVTTTIDQWKIIKSPFMMQYRNDDKNVLLRLGEYCKQLNVKFIVDDLS